MNPSHRIEEMKEVIERYKQRAEAAEAKLAEETHRANQNASYLETLTERMLQGESDLELGMQLIKRLERQVLEYQAQLAELAKQKPVLYALRFKNIDGSPERLINDNCLFRHRENAERYGLGGNYVKQESGKIEWVPNPALNPEVIPLFTRAATAKPSKE